MSSQPFRLYKPLTHILHNTLLQRIAEVEHCFSLIDIDAIYAYSSVDSVNHEEMCKALTQRFKQVHQRGDAVFSGDGLLFPLRAVRRGINGVQRCPNTSDALEVAKKEVEQAVLQDLLRLSSDDVSSRDVTSLWSVALQLSRWNFVEELLHHFPLKQTLAIQDIREYRDLILWTCQCNQVTPLDGSVGVAALTTEQGMWHAQRFLTDVFGVEESVSRLRAALASSAFSVHGDLTLEVRLREEREGNALVCAMLAATLRKRCGNLTTAFPVSEDEWAQWFGIPSTSSTPAALSPASSSPSTQNGITGNSLGSLRKSAPLRLGSGSTSFPVWSRRVLAVHDDAVPPYARATLAVGLTDDLQSIYHHCDFNMANVFFLIILPFMCCSNTTVDLKHVVRDYHNRVIEEIFWTAAVSPSKTTSGKRGKWTSQALAHIDDGSQTPKSFIAFHNGGGGTVTAAAASFHVSVDTALNILLGEVCLMDNDEPLVAAHVPAIESMLRTVLGHLRPLLHGVVRGAASTGTTSDKLPLSLWRAWSLSQSANLAVILSCLIRATALTSDATASSARSAYLELNSLVAEGLDLLRLVLDVSVLHERGTAAVLTTLLTFCPEVVDAVGGAAYEAQLRAMVIEHVTDGFTRQDLKAMAATVVSKQSRGGGDAATQASAMDFVRHLETAQLQLPLRLWH